MSDAADAIEAGQPCGYGHNMLLDNSSDKFRLAFCLRTLIANPNCRKIRIATGYWDLPGTNLVYDELKSFLEDRCGELDLLIGEDPHLHKGNLSSLPPGETFPDFYISQDYAKLTNALRPVAQLLLDHVSFDCGSDETSKVKIHIFGANESERQFLHAKCYICTDMDGEFARGIIGSSNFTAKGLGGADESVDGGNSELNYLETDPARILANGNPLVRTHVDWFNEKWANSRPWHGHFIMLIKASAIGLSLVTPPARAGRAPARPFTPYEVYIKLLQYKFNDVLDTSVGAEIKACLPSSYMALDYQIDAVKQCCAIMREHGGFILGDVVGLGKTIVGTLVVKRFLDDPEDREKQVLIITPPAVKTAWERTIAEFDDGKGDKIAPYIDFITVGSIDKLLPDMGEAGGDAGEDDDLGDTGDFEDDLKQKNYGLILIDESHKFRNSTTAMYKALDELIAKIGLSGHGYPYVGLLSATPQNNAPDDLKNQIYLFQRDHKCSTLETVAGRDLEAFFAAASKEYNSLRTSLKDIVNHPECHRPQDREDVNAALKGLAVKIRDSVLSGLLVRRTRTDLKLHYAADMASKDIVFPAISGPHAFKYVMEDDLAQLFSDTMNLLAPSEESKATNPDYLGYWSYQTVRFLKEEADKEKYRFKNLDVERFCRQLAAMTQMNLVKRLESSFSAFKASLRNLRDNTHNMIKMWESDTIFVCPQIDVNAELDVLKLKKKGKGGVLTFELCCKDVRAAIEKLDAEGKNEKGRNHEYHRTDFAPVGGKTYLECLQKDYELLNDLCNRWNAVTYDPKLEEFKSKLGPVLFNPATNTSQRLVIFTEAIDTVNAIKESVEHLGFRGKVLVVTAKNRKSLEPTIRANFDANFDGEMKDDYRILVTTEVLAEGVNLHRANCILNYDTPWNSTRLMQRIGRVNRIGSMAACVYVYNFMPSAEGDRLIKLVETAYVKLQSFHTLFGEDSKVFTADEELAHYSLGEMLDGEESIYEKFKTELKNYKAAHPERYAEILAEGPGLATAVGTGGNRYFLVASPTTSGLPVRYVTGTGKGEVISYKDMFAESRPEENAAPLELPSDWNMACNAAIQAFGQHMTKINTHVRNSAAATAAKKAIHVIRDTFNPPNGSSFKNLLLQTYDAVEKGNRDIINRVLKVAQIVGASDQMLIAMTASEVEDALKQYLEHAVSAVTQKLGTPFIYLGISL